MLFLLNEVVLDLDSLKVSPRAVSRRFRALSFNALIRLGQELYAEYPLLHRVLPERADRLAALIAAKAPLINAALFVAPRFGGRPDEVNVRFAQLDAEKMAALYSRQQAGDLDTLAADRQVWRRLAA
jgi:hypothetical protein